MVHSDVSPHVLTHGLQHMCHIFSEEEVTLMSCGVEEDGFLSLHRSGRVRFYTSGGYLRDHPTRSTVPYEGVAFTQIPGRLVGWGQGENLTLLDMELTPITHTQETLDIRVCQTLGSQELVTAGARNVCVWCLGHMVCRVQVVDGFEEECVFTCLALVPAVGQKAPRALAACGRSVTVVDLNEGRVLEHRTNLHRREITALVYCPLEDVVVTASKDVTMRVWGSEWELLMAFVGHTAVVTSLLLCPISGLLLSASLDSTLRSWSLQTGDQVNIVTPPTGYAPPLSVGGPSSTSTYFSFSKSGVDFWTFNSLYELHCKLSGDSAISPVRQILTTPSDPHYPARVVCVHGDHEITVISVETGAVLTAFQPTERVRCADYCLYKEALMVLTDEGSVIKASTMTNPVTPLDIWTNKESGWGDAFCMALYSHVGDEETALEEWKEVQQDRGEKPRVRKQLEEGKNRFLVMLGNRSGCVTVMNMHSGRVQYKMSAHNGKAITSIQAYPDSSCLLTAGEDNSVLLWRVYPYTDECVSVQTSVFCAHTPVCVSLLDSLLAVGLQQQHSATYSLVQLDLNTHTHTHTHTRCDHPPEHDHCSPITGLCVCPNLRVFASCSQDGSVRLWDEENRLLRILELNAEPECVQFSGRGGELLLGIRGDVYRIQCTQLLPFEVHTQLLFDDDLYNPVPDLPIACTDSESSKQRADSSHMSEVEYPEKQDQTKDALEGLLERNRDLCSLQSGNTHSRRTVRSSLHTRREAFNRYIRLLYREPLEISIPDEDPFDLDAALFPPKPPELRPLTPPILREGFFPNWSLAKKPDAIHTQDGALSRPPTAALGFVPNSVLVRQFWPDEVMDREIPSAPWTLRDQHTHNTKERTVDDVQCLDQQEDDEFNMNSIIHLIETSPEPESPTPPPPVTPPPEKPSPESPKYTLKPLKPLPPIKTSPPPTPPKPAPPTPTVMPTPVLPDFLKQFLQEEWFHSMYPDPGRIPESLSLTEFFAQLLDLLKSCVMDQKLCVLKAIITLHTHHSPGNTHTLTHNLLDTLHTCLHKDMSDMEQRFVVELLNFLVCVNPHSYDITVEILILLADKELRLQSVAVCMLQALGVDDAQLWLRPQLESWEGQAHTHTHPQRHLRELVHSWLNSWTAKYKIYKSAGIKSALFSLVVSPSEVLRYFCWLQKEAQVKPPGESERRTDTVLLDTHPDRWKALHRLGETNTMTRVRQPPGLLLPPLKSRPLLTGFTRLLSLPLPRVSPSSFPFSLEAHCLRQAPLQRYFLLERSYVQFYR